MFWIPMIGRPQFDKYCSVGMRKDIDINLSVMSEAM